MACYYPMAGWYSNSRNASGKRSIVFNRADAYVDRPVTIPCGQCIGCRLERSRQWAIRCVHEASLYNDNCFITLTFNDDHLPPDGSLHKPDFQKFMKRLRKRFGTRIRYFHCGEYGENFQRPHHHACLFGFDFPDKILWRERSGFKLYRSRALEELWPFGFCTIGEVNFDSAAYVARYVTKKITGKNAAEHYGDKQPEYITMSRRPGIAHDWFVKYKADVYPADRVIVRNNLQCKPPKYYDHLFARDEIKKMNIIKSRRKLKAKRNEADNTTERLVVKETIIKRNLKAKVREYESGGLRDT